MIKKKQHTTTGKLKNQSNSSLDVFTFLKVEKKISKASKNKEKQYNVLFTVEETEEDLNNE